MSSFFSVLLKVRVHPLTWIMVALAVLTAQFNELIILMAIVLIHELGHAMAAQWFHWRINSVVLLPFGGKMETDEHGNQSAHQEAIVLIAGLSQHIWLFALGLFLYAYGLMSEQLYHYWMTYNAVVLLVNLVPIWPLDGGKLFYLLCSRLYSYRKAHTITMVVSIILLLIGIVSILLLNPFNLNWWMIVVFLLFSIWDQWRQRKYIFLRFLLNRHYGHRPEINRIIALEVEWDDLVYSVLEGFWRNCKHIIIVKKDGNELGKLDESEVLHACFSDKIPHQPVGELLHPY